MTDLEASEDNYDFDDEAGYECAGDEEQAAFSACDAFLLENEIELLIDPSLTSFLPSNKAVGRSPVSPAVEEAADEEDAGECFEKDYSTSSLQYLCGGTAPLPIYETAVENALIERREKLELRMESEDERGNFPCAMGQVTDDYRVTSEIVGIGESGKVMACYSKANGEKFALKVLRDNVRSRREIELHYLTSSHENISRIMAIYENVFEGVKCLLVVVEFMEGGDLLSLFENQSRMPYSEKTVARIISQIGRALEFLHERNIAHRDVKLENILCSTNDLETCVFKLADFGFARKLDVNRLMSSPCCTPAYVCPEIISRVGYDRGCDIWALGVATYILLCGYPPFYSLKGLPFSPGMRDRIPKHLVCGMLKTEPAERVSIRGVLMSEFIRRNTIFCASNTDVGSKRPSLPNVRSDASLSESQDEVAPLPLSSERAKSKRSLFSTDNYPPPMISPTLSPTIKVVPPPDTRGLDFDAQSEEEADGLFHLGPLFTDFGGIASFWSRRTLRAISTMNFVQQNKQQQTTASANNDADEEKEGNEDTTTSQQMVLSRKAASTRSARCLLAGSLRNSWSSKGIQEEVNRALIFMRLGGDLCRMKGSAAHAPLPFDGKLKQPTPWEPVTKAAIISNSNLPFDLGLIDLGMPAPLAEQPLSAIRRPTGTQLA